MRAKRAEEPGENIAPPIGRKVVYGAKSILRRAARDGTKGPDVCRKDLKYPPTAVGGIRSKQ